MKKALNIAIAGTRGIPNHYGGFEQCAEYLATALIQRGHVVTVYCSSLHPESHLTTYMGVRLIHCADWEDKLGTAGQFIYDFNCISHMRKERFDVILQLGYTSSSLWFWCWPKASRHIVNMDGLEHRRAKYNRFVQRFLKLAEKMATYRADYLVADNPAIERYLKGRYKVPVRMISYGAEIPTSFDHSLIRKMGFQVNGFDLVIARIEPENHIEEIVNAYRTTDQRLVIVGGLNTPLAQRLRQNTNDNIHWVGAIYDKPVLDALRHDCRYYLHGHSVGGTNPSLLEAMAAEALIVAHDNPFNRAVLGAKAYYFQQTMDISSLVGLNPERAITDKWKVDNLNKIRSNYAWPEVTLAYENLCHEVAYS